MTDRHPTPDQPDTGTPRVLIIEDDADTAALAREAVEDHFGKPCVTHVNRLALLAKQPLDRFDVILCDFNLPDGTGLDALRAMRERGVEAPVVMVTGQSQPETAVAAVREGAADYIVKTREFLSSLPLVIEKNLATARILRENRRLQSALNASLAELRQRNGDLQEAVLKLEQMALTDDLTGLSNRRRVQGLLGQMFAQAVRYKQDLACVMADLDGFKAINDSLGHQMGDSVLNIAGQLIAEQVRKSDVAARFGGDEFVLLLPHTSCDTAALLAQRLSVAFETRVEALVGKGPRCSMSIGISCLNLSQPSSPEHLLAHADKALYAAKGAGRRRIMVYGPSGEATPVERVVPGCSPAHR